AKRMGPEYEPRSRRRSHGLNSGQGEHLVERVGHVHRAVGVDDDAPGTRKLPWELVDLHQRIAANRSAVRWYYTLVLKETAGPCMQFEREQVGAYGSGVEPNPWEPSVSSASTPIRSFARVGQRDSATFDAGHRRGISNFGGSWGGMTGEAASWWMC